MVSLITESTVQALGLKKIPNKVRISGVGGVNVQLWPELSHLQLADPKYEVPNKIDLLLGAEVYAQVLEDGMIKGPPGCPLAQKTHLGWILSGHIQSEILDSETHQQPRVIVSMHAGCNEDELLKRFWEIEAEPCLASHKIMTIEEKACEDIFERTTKRDREGRYIVDLPFRPEEKHEFGDTRSVAVQRLRSLEKRFKNIELKNNYTQVLKEYLLLGHMEKVQEDSEETRRRSVWLPHHAVVRPDKSTTKTRVVFNASDRSANGISLNDTLMVGPRLQPELRHIIMRWRLHPICLIADIIKMYRQVKLKREHTDYHRIVWRDDNNEIQDYRLLTVTFGTSSAPYLAVKALQQVAVDEGGSYPLAAAKLKTDFYMDDLLTGCDSEKEALRLYEEMNELLSKGGFKLQKWSSNSMEVMEGFEGNIEQDRELKEDDVTKVVGLFWNRRTDDFSYRVQFLSASLPATKREIISEICRLYDPLGWIAPCIITAKIFIQKLWMTGFGWDDKLPSELISEWITYREELFQLTNFQIPRWVQTRSKDTVVELHGFSDASHAAYAAVVYIRCISEDKQIKTHLVAAKTKVAPIKQISLPRLELCGAMLVTKLLVEVAEVLNIPISQLHAWTDSTIVLAWLSDHPSRWKTFIANRTSEILNHLEPCKWSYIQSKENPADCASRGILPSELVDNNLWKYGPDWLSKIDIQYGKPLSICTKTDLEERKVKVHAATKENCEDIDIFLKFSSFTKLVRVVAYCRRFLKLKDPVETRTKFLPYLSAEELRDATMCCIRQHQLTWYPEEMKNLKQKNIIKKSKIDNLNPLIDELGIMRVGGRIENSYLKDSSKHPMIINGDSCLAKLIIADAHANTMHGGLQLTINYVRSTYWITKLKNLVRFHIHKCVRCIRNAAKFKTQLMGQLPACRVTPQKPFLYSGVDYAGPINIRVSKGRGHKSYKGYICLFVCMATRAVHIEAVSDLTSEGFLAAFKRFVARRGRCIQLWSDNGTNFVGASKELRNLFAIEKSQMPVDIASSLANNGTEWRFIPPHAPNFGGVWEAGIKSTKHHLRRVIGDSTLTYEELATVLVQIEACLNSRPLSVASSDSGDPNPLTPGHFLIGEPLIMAPDNNFEYEKISNLRRWQLTQRMVQHFWKRWSQECLTQFFQRYKWKGKVPDIKVGDVVLVKEDNLPPAKWMYGLVVKLHPGNDKVTRVVTLRYRGSHIQRPTSKLCVLPVRET
ncbi:uncharacterized protein LOC123706034 [Colias croceus]|uniref:uncharacterized protein LOC123706034 n=1 Tax=Colias crocea TaxID=72248 RepID=UPI001E27FF2D|nr:uncharacterized protein LOC123706034 [Colias croceus]